ncbi:36466_t:CDS:1, partial [Gigaspora margarita]
SEILHNDQPIRPASQPSIRNTYQNAQIEEAYQVFLQFYSNHRTTK